VCLERSEGLAEPKLGNHSGARTVLPAKGRFGVQRSEEQRRQGPKVRFDTEPPDLPLTQEQVDAFIAMMRDYGQAGSDGRGEEDSEHTA
jgi:hypothetical protein